MLGARGFDRGGINEMRYCHGSDWVVHGGGAWRRWRRCCSDIAIVVKGAVRGQMWRSTEC